MTGANIIESVSIIIAAWTVILGITAWRREYVGKRNIELAEEVLCLFYESKDAINHIRNPFSWANEGSTRERKPEESKEEKEVFDRAFVTFERYNHHKELFNKLYSMRYRYMARFGKDSAKPFDDLNSVLGEILDSAGFYSQARIEQIGRKYDDPRDLSLEKEIKNYKSVLWSRGKDDIILPKVDAFIREIETQSKNVLQPTIVNKIKQLFVWF